MKGSVNMSKTVRKNITMSEELADYFEMKAKELGISQSAMMVVALSDYVKQDKTIEMMSNMEFFSKVIQETKNPSRK
jgi:hypothetical protein